MTEKRYFKRMWEEEYYIFDSNTISERDFEEKLDYEGYRAFEDSMMGDEVVNRLNEQHETITDNEEYIKDLEYQLKGFKKDYNDCGEYLKEYQQKVKDTLQRHYKILKNQNKVLNNDNGSIGLLEYIADELGIDLQ